MNFKYIIGLILIIPLMLLMSGCSAKQITPDLLTPDRLQLSKKSTNTVSIKVDGGREFAPNGVIQEITNENLLHAVRNTIEQSKLFSAVLDKNSAFNLELFIVGVNQPAVPGANLPVKIEIAWILKSHDGSILWKKSITTTGLHPDSRNKIVYSTIAATKDNIVKGLEELSKNDLL